MDFYIWVCTIAMGDREPDLSTAFRINFGVDASLGPINQMIADNRMDADVAEEMASRFGGSEEKYCQRYTDCAIDSDLDG
jgi:hypothetical protein